VRLKVMTPTRIAADEAIERVSFVGEDGARTLLPRHLDFVSALVPSILSLTVVGCEEEFMAVDQGLVCKAGDEVLVSTENAVRGGGLGQLQETIAREFVGQDERERSTRATLARLESSILRRFLELGETLGR